MQLLRQMFMSYLTDDKDDMLICDAQISLRMFFWKKAMEAKEDLLGVAVLSGPGTSEALAACTQPPAMEENEDMGPPEMPDGLGDFSDAASAVGGASAAGGVTNSPPKNKSQPLPLVDMSASQVLAAPASNKDDVVAFDELFEKFCGGGSNQFAYFDECWSKLARDKNGKTSGALADAEGALAEVKEPKDWIW